MALERPPMDSAGVQLDTLSVSQNTNTANQQAVTEYMVENDATVASANVLTPVQSTLDHSVPCLVNDTRPSIREPRQGHLSWISQLRGKGTRMTSCLPAGKARAFVGTAIALVTLIVSVIALLPSFGSRRYDRGALELAIWTAKKDYMEACQQVLTP